MTVEVINSLEKFNSITEKGEIVVIDFWATWCGPCKVISPIFAKLAERPEFSKIKFCQVDVDDQEAISQKVEIRAMPTFVVYKGGKRADDLVGANPEGLKKLLDKAVAPPESQHAVVA